MRLSEINSDESYEMDPILSLKRLQQATGNSIMNGFLGEDLSNCYFDDNGYLEFMTDCEREGVKIHSCGAVLEDSVIIKQVQSDRDNTTHHLYSWDLNNYHYTFLAIEDEDHLNRFYDTIKRTNTNLCVGDISDNFKKIGLSFDFVNRVLLNQSIDPFHQMFDDEFTKDEKENSFVM